MTENFDQFDQILNLHGVIIRSCYGYMIIYRSLLLSYGLYI